MTLHISNLSKRYGNNWVLREISFDAEKGSVLAILGPPQSGKTTLINILAGAEKTTPAGERSPADGREIELCCRATNSSRLWPFGRQGETRTPAADVISRSLERASDILLFDEILSDSDRESRESCLSHIRKTAIEKRLTVIYATSDFETAATVADKITVLADSYIHQIGTAEELYESPHSTVVAKLTGRCNIFPARRLTSTKFDVPEFQSLEGDHRFFAERADIAKLGAINRDVSLAIRPENISMSFGASFPEDNLVKAVVTGIKFLGPVTLVELDASGLKLNALVFRLVGLGIGQECMLGLPPDRIKILSD